MESILSLPIWFNRTLQTKFDPEISMAGFNNIQDLYPENQPTANFNGLRNIKIRKLRTLQNKIPQGWLDKIIQVPVQQLAIIPRLKVNLGGQSQIVTNISCNKS